MDVMKRRFNSEDFTEYSIKGEKIVIGLEDVKDIFRNVIKKELVDKLEEELKKKLIRRINGK